MLRMKQCKPKLPAHEAIKFIIRINDDHFEYIDKAREDKIHEKLNLQKKTVVIVHGYRTLFKHDRGVLREWANVWAHSEDVNVVLVDWHPWAFCAYPLIVKKFAVAAADYLSSKLAFMIQHTTREKVIFAGHSAGGNIAGLTSRKLEQPIPLCYS